MIGPIKNYKKYCVFYKYITLLILLSIAFLVYEMIMSKDNKMTTVYVTQLIMLSVAYFANRMLLSICMN